MNDFPASGISGGSTEGRIINIDQTGHQNSNKKKVFSYWRSFKASLCSLVMTGLKLGHGPTSLFGLQIF
jgi:hypothetical protein